MISQPFSLVGRYLKHARFRERSRLIREGTTMAGKERFPQKKHPVLEQFLQEHQCEKAKADLAFRVYMNLTEVRAWRDVRMHYCEKLKSPFVTGRSTLSSDLEAVLPVAMEDSLTHEQILSVCSSLSVEDLQFNSVMMAICAVDTSIVYFRMTTGIVKPEPPESSDTRKQEWNQKNAKRRRQLAESIQQYSQRQNEDEFS